VKYVKGLASLAALLVLVIGIPLALILVAGNPVPSGETLSRLLTTPDYGGQFLFGSFLPVVAWIAWLTFAISVAMELPPALSGIRPRRIRGLGTQQALAGALIGTILFMFTAGSLAGAPAAHAAPEPLVTTQISAPQVVQTEAAPALEQEAPARVLPKHTVLAGESLWKVAEQHLGDGSRFGEISDLNYGVAQADGGALSDDHWIEPGWVLVLPAGSETVPAAQSVTHVVTEGESLSSIAQQYYGDEAAYEAIFAASSATVQQDGRQLTDPGFIAPGWELTVPPKGAEAEIVLTPASSTAVPESPVSSPISGAAVSSAPLSKAEAEADFREVLEAADSRRLLEAGGMDGPAAAPRSALHVSPEMGMEEVGHEAADMEFPTRTIGGIGSILAASVLSILGLKRIGQRRQRKAGERIVVPSRAEQNLELQLRAVEDPMAIDHLDRALKFLAVWGQNESKSLPQMFCVRVAPDEIALYLGAAAVLPEPFVAADTSNTVWTVEPKNLLPLERVPTAPYPALVSVGQDAQNANLLVDLEYVGALGIAGETELVSNALTALAVQLATSKWGGELQITMVGFSDELPAVLSTGKVRHVYDLAAMLVLLRGKATATGEAFISLGVSGVEEARTLGKDAEGWMPEIIFLAQQPTEEQRAELEKLVTAIPRLGVAAVSAGRVAGDWEIRIGSKDAATLEPLGLEMIPQIITAEENQKIKRLMSAASQDPVPGPEWASTASSEDISVEDVPVASQAQDRPLYAIVPDSLGEQVMQAVEQEDPIPAGLEEVIRRIDIGQEDAGAAPIISVLGSVAVMNPQGEAPKTAASGSVSEAAVARCTALAAFLALNPGASSEEYHEAFWPTADPNGQLASFNRNKLSNLTRNYLGQRHDGQMYFPHVDAAGYQLHPEITTDWHVFLELIGENLSRTSTPRLVAALRLVRGQPFSGVKYKLYGWAELVRGEMIAAICDAAHELAGRSLKAGGTANARLAGSVGRFVDPANEQMWRDALLAEHAAGNSAGIEELVAQLYGYLENFNDHYEPNEETQDLIEELRRQGHPIAS
jgi:nucleoid-associated protein YgaU/DNA-binding SARP family transcriptional activator